MSVVGLAFHIHLCSLMLLHEMLPGYALVYQGITKLSCDKRKGCTPVSHGFEWVKIAAIYSHSFFTRLSEDNLLAFVSWWFDSRKYPSFFACSLNFYASSSVILICKLIYNSLSEVLAVWVFNRAFNYASGWETEPFEPPSEGGSFGKGFADGNCGDGWKVGRNTNSTSSLEDSLIFSLALRCGCWFWDKFFIGIFSIALDLVLAYTRSDLLYWFLCFPPS